MRLLFSFLYIVATGCWCWRTDVECAAFLPSGVSPLLVSGRASTVRPYKHCTCHPSGSFTGQQCPRVLHWYFFRSVFKFLRLICLLIRTAVWRGCCTKASCWRKRTSITLTGRSSTMTSRRPSRFCGVRWTRFHRRRSGFQSVGSTRLIRQPHLIDNEEQRAAFELYGRS